MPGLRVADEVWIATALLHRQYPDREDFSVREIVRRAATARATGVEPLRPGVQSHAYSHCVANRPPGPGRYRMLVETARGRRRLYRPGDPCHPLRARGRHLPDPARVPPAWRGLIDWYRGELAGPGGGDPVLALAGIGGAEAESWLAAWREGRR